MTKPLAWFVQQSVAEDEILRPRLRRGGLVMPKPRRRRTQDDRLAGLTQALGTARICHCICECVLSRALTKHVPLATIYMVNVAGRELFGTTCAFFV